MNGWMNGRTDGRMGWGGGQRTDCIGLYLPYFIALPASGRLELN